MCACAFLEAYGPLVAAAGGFALVMPDVWGDFDTGARPLLERLLGERLVQADSPLLLFCSRDLARRMGWAAENVQAQSEKKKDEKDEKKAKKMKRNDVST